MNSFTLIFIGIFVVCSAALLLSKVKNHTSLRNALSSLLIGGTFYYAIAPILLIPIPIPCTLIAQCIGYIFLLISLKRLVLSLLE